VGREHNGWIGMIRPGGKYVEPIALDRNLPALVSQPDKFSIKIISNLSFIPGNGFNVDELSGERDCVHAGENSKADALSPDPCPLNFESNPLSIEQESESDSWQRVS
jgi:hypothetical protein